MLPDPPGEKQVYVLLLPDPPAEKQVYVLLLPDPPAEKAGTCTIASRLLLLLSYMLPLTSLFKYEVTLIINILYFLNKERVLLFRVCMCLYVAMQRLVLFRKTIFLSPVTHFSPLCHGFPSGPGVDSACSKNEYQEYILGGR